MGFVTELASAGHTRAIYDSLTGFSAFAMGFGSAIVTVAVLFCIFRRSLRPPNLNHIQNEQQERFILDAIPFFIAYINPRLRYSFVNQHYCHQFKCSRELIVGKTVSEVLGPDLFAKRRGHLEAGLGGRTFAYDAVTEFPGSPGLRYFHLTYIPDISQQGKVRGLVVVGVDITERKRTELTLRADEERFRATADMAPVYVWTCDTEGRCDWVNKQWLEFTGVTFESCLGAGWLDAIHPDDQEACSSAFMDHFQHRLPFSLEYRLRRRDGEFRWIIDNGVPRWGQDGSFLGYIGSCFDITAQRHADTEQQELLLSERTARGEAERMSRMKDDFFATISHELRTPLQAILGWSAILRNGPFDKALFERGVETIERNAQVQSRLIEDLLDISRSLTGKIHLNIEPVILFHVFKTALSSVELTAKEKNIQLDLIVTDETALTECDPIRIQQVVWNLLNNAMQFTPPKGRVTVHLSHNDCHSKLVVSDTGIGIDPKFLPQVFERFRQADLSNLSRHGGMGLGLSIVKDIIEMHGGSICAESQGIGQGASFTVTLPRIVNREVQNAM